MEFSKVEISVINLVLIAYAFIGLCTEYGRNHGGWIIGSMIVLVYASLAFGLLVAKITVYNQGE